MNGADICIDTAVDVDIDISDVVDVDVGDDVEVGDVDIGGAEDNNVGVRCDCKIGSVVLVAVCAFSDFKLNPNSEFRLKSEGGIRKSGVSGEVGENGVECDAETGVGVGESSPIETRRPRIICGELKSLLSSNEKTG